jgi:hypothetical protein
MHAQAHQVMETTRQLSKANEAIVGHMQAVRERQAKMRGLPLATAPQAGVNILLIEDDPADE